MAYGFYSLSSIFIPTLSFLLLWCVAAENRKAYIVYMGSLPQGDYSPTSHHLSLLQQVLEDNSAATNLLIRSFKRSFNGFAAMLTDEEAQRLARMEQIVSVFPSTNYQLHTTRSWDFMGFHDQTVTEKLSNHSDVIIGVLDTGIWPESKSFTDEGFGPKPKKWKGDCVGPKDFKCNNKVIGAQNYAVQNGDGTPRDLQGHGSHSASIAAGNLVNDVNFYGLAQGTARGGLPAARIAVYKVCEVFCNAHSILSAFDDAIADGVDIITISIGPMIIFPFDEDVIAIGGFHAMKKGVLTIQSAGNNGPEPGSLGSQAPWLLSVGASTIDRRFIDKVLLGDGKTIVGNSINTFSLNDTSFPLVYGKGVSSNCSEMEAENCKGDCIDSNLVKGKIVLCRNYDGIDSNCGKGAIGTIALSFMDDVSFVEPMPSASVVHGQIDAVESYINSTEQPKASILKSEVIKDPSAPLVGSFSSRGPNTLISDLMKPDVVAPGVDILAAYSPAASPSTSIDDPRHVQYSIVSGTSVACPHVAGVAAYVKSLHPDWSPSAIKSAIMTTAWPMNASQNLGGEFAYGSGHINPNNAANPGLVYETEKEDYVDLLCYLGYSTKRLQAVTGDNSTCSGDGSKKTSPVDLNYPSMTVKLKSMGPFNITFHRTVTNVGLPNSTYNVKLILSSKFDINVAPQVLHFETVSEKKTFTVTLTGKEPVSELQSASLVWSDGTHTVRSPIAIFS